MKVYFLYWFICNLCNSDCGWILSHRLTDMKAREVKEAIKDDGLIAGLKEGGIMFCSQSRGLRLKEKNCNPPTSPCMDDSSHYDIYGLVVCTLNYDLCACHATSDYAIMTIMPALGVLGFMIIQCDTLFFVSVGKDHLLSLKNKLIHWFIKGSEILPNYTNKTDRDL